MAPRARLSPPLPVVCASLLLLAASAAGAHTIDPSVPRSIEVGRPRAYFACDRVDSQRTGRTAARLPAAPVEIWRRHVGGALDFAPLVDETGNVVVGLTMPEIVKLSPEGRELWRARVGTSSPSSPPAILSDGTIVVVTSGAMAWAFTPAGTLRYAVPLGVRGRDVDVPPVPLENGRFAIAAGSAVVEVDADGNVRGRATLMGKGPGAGQTTMDRAAGILASPKGLLVTSDTGTVYRVRTPAPAARVGSLGGAIRGGPFLADDRTLVAVVDGRRVVALDLETGAARTRMSGVPLDPFAGVGPGGTTLVTTMTGFLLAFDAVGTERLQLALEKGTAQTTAVGLPQLGGFLAQTDPLKPSPAVVLDAANRVGFVRSNGRAGVVGSDGRVQVASERVCSAPVGITPAGAGRMLVACKDGGLWMFGE